MVTRFSVLLWDSQMTEGAKKKPTPRPNLTSRQVEILRLIVDGLQTKEIAIRLGISPKSVEFHRTRLYAAIEVTNVVGAVKFAIREGYSTP
jgi:DNA-binding NarL/FixJ family response regulator